MTEKFTDLWTPEQNVAEAARLVSENGSALQGWLRDEGLELADATDAVWGGLMTRWKSDGISDAAQSWFRASKRELVRRSVSKRKPVCAQIAIKFAEARMRRSADFVRPMKVVESQDYSFLPDYLQWVAKHPGLRLDLDKRIGCCESCKRPFQDPVQRAILTEYEQATPAPNEMALNRYQLCLDDEKYRGELFKEIDAQCREERKRKDKTGQDVSVESDDPDLVDLESELARMRGVNV